MGIKAVSFDIGHTLVNYNNPLNWKALYEIALIGVALKCNFDIKAEDIQRASLILNKYNTRENPRETEVDSDTIFAEMFDAWGRPHIFIEPAKEAFYGFFQNNAACFDDTVDTLRALRDKNIKIGVLTDVAYGMDNKFSLRDIDSIREYLDAVCTSVDVGFRKPHRAGYKMLLNAFGAAPSQMMFIGDEEKDITGANSLGIISVLIDRDGSHPDFGQKYTVGSLSEILTLIE